MANFTAKRIQEIYEVYTDQYKLAKDSGVKLAEKDNIEIVARILNNPKNEIYKTMSNEQVASALIEDLKRVSYNPEGTIHALVSLMDTEFLQKWELKVSKMLPGEKKEKHKQVIEDLKNIKEAIGEMKKNLVNDPAYRQAVMDALWEITNDKRLMHLINSPQDADDPGELDSLLSKAIAKL